jgi:predicted transcriptional regulator
LERITIRLDEVEKELLQDYAESAEMTVSQIVRKAIKEFLDRNTGR